METVEIPKDVWSPISSLVRHGIYNFEDFRSKVEAAEKEDFEKWDDYIEWKAYFTAYNYWKSIHEESSRWL